MTPEATAPDHDALIVHACRSVRTDLLAHEVIRDQPMLKDTLTSNYDTLTLRQETTVSPVVTAATGVYGREITLRQEECSRRDTLSVIMRPLVSLPIYPDFSEFLAGRGWPRPRPDSTYRGSQVQGSTGSDYMYGVNLL